jgi:hypothetical protein
VVYKNYIELKERRVRKQNAVLMSFMFFIRYKTHYCRRMYGMNFSFRHKNYIRRVISFAAAGFLLTPISDSIVVQRNKDGEVAINSKWV